MHLPRTVLTVALAATTATALPGWRSTTKPKEDMVCESGDCVHEPEDIAITPQHEKRTERGGDLPMQDIEGANPIHPGDNLLVHPGDDFYQRNQPGDDFYQRNHPGDNFYQRAAQPGDDFYLKPGQPQSDERKGGAPLLPRFHQSGKIHYEKTIEEQPLHQGLEYVPGPAHVVPRDVVQNLPLGGDEFLNRNPVSGDYYITNAGKPNYIQGGDEKFQRIRPDQLYQPYQPKAINGMIRPDQLYQPGDEKDMGRKTLGQLYQPGDEKNFRIRPDQLYQAGDEKNFKIRPDQLYQAGDEKNFRIRPDQLYQGGGDEKGGAPIEARALPINGGDEKYALPPMPVWHQGGDNWEPIKNIQGNNRVYPDGLFAKGGEGDGGITTRSIRPLMKGEEPTDLVYQPMAVQENTIYQPKAAQKDIIHQTKAAQGTIYQPKAAQDLATGHGDECLDIYNHGKNGLLNCV